MEPNKPNPFLNRVNKIHSAEDEQARQLLIKEQQAQEKRKKLEEEGPSIARLNINTIKPDIAETISQVKRDFKIPEHPQKNADIEVVIKENWLLTAKLEGIILTFDTYFLPAQGNPRMKEKSGSLDTKVYKLIVDTKGEWNWQEQRDKPAKTLFNAKTSKIFTSGGAPNPTEVHTRDMAQHILYDAADILEWVNKQPKDAW